MKSNLRRLFMLNVPKLRFGEFSGEWENSELNNLIEISSKKFNPKTNNENMKCIELEHISQGTGELLGFTYSNKQESTKNIFKKNQVLFGKLRPYLKKYSLVNFDGVCSSEIWVLDGKKVVNNYLFQLVQTYKFNQIANISSGSKMPRADWKYMSEIPFFIPQKLEQQKIATFLTAVDKKIEQQTKKKTLLEAYKKGVMQKIFSQEIRFKGDDGGEYEDWVEKKLEEIFKIGSGKDYKHLSSGNIPVYGTGGYMTSVNEYLYDGESVCIGRKGTIDKPRYIVGKFWTVDTLFYTHSFNQSIPKFVYLIFQRINWKKYNEASGVPSLSKSTIESIKINLPSLEEQIKIANFLSSIDQKIEQASKQIEASKAFKKGLLQQMFV
ncbi:MAG: Type I restriction-modification system, specificity subunit S (EC [uncultured Sulfurovum sp.]|uniref:Type I restriction-modification system, specificity subunit S (EC) n=1 Tax=uncultured Sulfurovum sp. TaxID=269237 RepID=A0A6S6U352_9BACT|nr:MAG: Type I restriction-modification system, specificity subunit S (EC [uncultured Sulfurovum sp.]